MSSSFLKTPVAGPSLVAVLAACAVCLPQLSSAAEYRFSPRLHQQLGYSDNLSLRAEGFEVESFMYTLSPILDIRARGGLWNTSLNTRLDFERMSETRFDTDNQQVRFKTVRTSERTTFDLNITLDRDSTRTSESETTGFISEASRRQSLNATPSITFQVGERNSLYFDAGFRNVHYDSLNFDDFDNVSANVGWFHQLSQKSRTQVFVYGSQFDSVGYRSICPGSGPRNVEFKSDTLGIQAGFDSVITERWSAGLSVGGRRVDSEGLTCAFFPPFFFLPDTVESDSNGLTGQASLTYRGDRFSVSAEVSRGINPAGIGFLLQDDRARIGIDYLFSEKVTGSIDLSWFQNQSAVDEIEFDRNSYRITPKITWKLSEHWQIDAMYRYTSQTYADASNRNDGNAIFVNLRYDRTPYVMSR